MTQSELPHMCRTRDVHFLCVSVRRMCQCAVHVLVSLKLLSLGLAMVVGCAFGMEYYCCLQLQGWRLLLDLCSVLVD